MSQAFLKSHGLGFSFFILPLSYLGTNFMGNGESAYSLKIFFF